MTAAEETPGAARGAFNEALAAQYAQQSRDAAERDAKKRRVVRVVRAPRADAEAESVAHEERPRERYADFGGIEEILAGGHEVGHHGYTHTSPSSLSPEAEEAELVRGREILTGLGADVRGYRSPSWDFSPVTLDLLVGHGFQYSSNLMDDIRPYKHEHHDIVELPVHWTLDDAPHFWFDGASWTKTIRTSAEVRALWEEEYAGMAALDGLFMLTMHPQVIGRPGRIQMLESFLGWMRDRGASFSTARAVAESVG